MRSSNRLLWGLVIISLILNLALIFALNLARLTALDTLEQVETILDGLAQEVIVYNVELSQDVPIKADVPLKQTMEIPLNTTIPIDQILTVPFQTPTGEIELDMPLQMDFPIDMVIPMDFNETIELDTTVHLDTSVPVQIEIAQTSLAGYLAQARANVAQLRGRLSLQGEAQAIEEAPSEAVVDKANANSLSDPGEESQSQFAAGEGESDTTLTGSDPSRQLSSETRTSSDNDLVQQSSDLCAHPYWPLRPGTSWTYNSIDTSYTLTVDTVAGNQVVINTQYEDQDVLSNLECFQEGLGGGYLGEMRRLTEFGTLTFTGERGLFLPQPDVMEQIGTSWAQEFNVNGTVEALQGNAPVIGEISRGLATATYTPTGFETLETHLGPREALRIEQKLDLELHIMFDLSSQSTTASEFVTLQTVFWFVKGIGPVQIHWQGGPMQQEHEFDGIQSFSVPPLVEEQLVFVCVLTEKELSECLRVINVSETDLTIPPESELEIAALVFPDAAAANVQTGENLASEMVGSGETDELINDQTGSQELPEAGPAESPQDADDRSSVLLAYAEIVARIGAEITEAGEAFGESALAYRNGGITLDKFRGEFDSFGSDVEGPIREIDGLSPPPDAASIHQKLIDGLDKCDEAIDLMDDWFDSQDSGTRDSTILLVASCMNQVSEADDELEALVRK